MSNGREIGSALLLDFHRILVKRDKTSLDQPDPVRLNNRAATSGARRIKAPIW